MGNIIKCDYGFSFSPILAFFHLRRHPFMVLPSPSAGQRCRSASGHHKCYGDHPGASSRPRKCLHYLQSDLSSRMFTSAPAEEALLRPFHHSSCVAVIISRAPSINQSRRALHIETRPRGVAGKLSVCRARTVRSSPASTLPPPGRQRNLRWLPSLPATEEGASSFRDCVGGGACEQYTLQKGGDFSGTDTAFFAFAF